MSRSVSSTASLASGEVVAGRYRIEGLLGQGGMGSVYRAVQLSVGRSVALKLLTPEQPASAEHVTRFEREALALSRLQHPSTVRLFDFGELEPGRPFIVMELLGGADLQLELAHNGPMRWDQALGVCQQILGSLGEAHELGIVHRDIKPANVQLCAGPGGLNVKLLDFGIAGSIELASTRKLTATGTVLGSAPYMSPEQAQGQLVGPAADLYALGVVLFEMLTGQTPFAGRGFTAQLVAKVLEPAPSVLDACPERALPGPLVSLVAQLLERDAAQRPASARVLREQIDALLASAGELPPLVRTLPPAQVERPLPRTVPMLVPPTIADGWAPRSTPSPVPALPRRRRRRPLVAAVALLPLLAAGWWAQERVVAPAWLGLSSSAVAELASLAAPEDQASASSTSQPLASALLPEVAITEAAPAETAASTGSATSAAPRAAEETGSTDTGDQKPSSESAVSRAGVGSDGSTHPDASRPVPAPPVSAPTRPRRSRPPRAALPVKQAGTPPAAAPSRAEASPSFAAAPAPAAGGRGETAEGDMPAVAQGPEAAGSGTASTSPASTGSPDAEVGSGALPPASGAIEPSGAAPSAANAGIPGSSIPGGNPMAGVPSQAPAQTSPPPGGTLPTETLPTPGERDPRPPYWGNSGPRAQSLPERRGRPLAWRYPSIAAAREAELRGEITPDERNQVIVELRRARQAERSRAIRDYRAGYIGRGVLRARLRDIERRYDGPFGDYPRAGIHVWP